MQHTVAVTGASGFVGRAVIRALRERGSRVIALGRSPAAYPDAGIEPRAFDPAGPPNPGAFAGADAVVHLAGETVDGRWTTEKKWRIADSRIRGTNTVVASLAALPKRPAALICASAVGVYGDRGDEPLTEASPAGTGFLAEVCTGWEASARAAGDHGIRSVQLRIGVVLGNGGALAKMRVPFSLGIGGPLGSGRQFMPWIHVDDLAALALFAIDNEALRGPVNAVAPDYATNARFSQVLGAALRRPSLLPAPPIALRAVLGEFADTVLGGQLVIPAAALDAGFHWNYPTLEGALGTLLAAGSRTLGLHAFRTSLVVRRPLEEVFAFFSDARNLEAITPPRLGFTIRRIPEHVERGAVIEYDLRLHGVPIRWMTLISAFEPPYRFADVQLHGPYALWRHTHTFRAVEGGVEVADAVDYLLPFAPFGELAAGFVANDVNEIFRFRGETLARVLA
jgi:uncharacterized protein (TIGR01777 family)